MAVLGRILWFVVVVQAAHFDGGSIRWTPLNNSAMASPVQIMISQSYSYTLSSVTCSIGSRLVTTGIEVNYNLSCSVNCGATSAGYAPPPVVGYCVGFNSALNIGFSQRSDVVTLAAGDYFSVTFGILNTLSTGYYRPLTLLGGGTNSLAHWNITAAIDVRVRADNGRINTPPVANLISPRGIPLNIPTEIVIPTLDIDNDHVRCRWSNSSLECGDVCYPSTLPSSISLSSNCILNITGTSLTAWYAGSIQVEDFSTSTSTTALSSIPIQFLIYVYAPKICPVPTLTGPSTCIDVQVGVSTTVTLTATNNCGSTSNISDILVQSFTGIVQGSLAAVTPPLVYKRDIVYTPLAIQLGPQIVCAIALDDTNVPSDQYCITFIVSANTAAAVCSSLMSTTHSPSISTTGKISNRSSIDWVFIGTIIGLAILLSLLICLCCCYYFFWASKLRLRRRQRQRLARASADQTLDNRSDYSTAASSFPLKSYNVYNVDLTTNDTCIAPPTDAMPSRQIVSSHKHHSATLVKEIKFVSRAKQGDQGSVSTDSANDANEKQATSRIKTRNSRKVRKIKSVTVRPVTKAEQGRIMNDNQLRKQTAQSTIHVSRVPR